MDPDLPPRTWQRAKWAWKLLKATRAENRGDFDEALQLIDEAARSKALLSASKVQRAKLLLKAGRLPESQSAFASLRKELDGSPDPDLQYLKRYCEAMLGMITGNIGALAVAEREVRSIPCRPRLRRRFPLQGRDDG